MTMLGKHHSQETKDKISKSRTGILGTDVCKQKHSEIATKLWQDPEYRWNNIKFREEVEAKVLKANQVRPNRAEKQLLGIFEDKFPNCWKYVGDGSFWIEGKNPDFVNINGQKQVIELFGEYWHKGTDQNRIKLFKKYGFGTLIVWASELKHPEQVVAKIQKFEEASYV